MLSVSLIVRCARSISVSVKLTTQRCGCRYRPDPGRRAWHRPVLGDVRTGIATAFLPASNSVDRRRTRLHDRHQQARQLGRLTTLICSERCRPSVVTVVLESLSISPALWMTHRRAACRLPEQLRRAAAAGGIAQIDLQLLDLRQRRGCTGDIDDPPALLRNSAQAAWPMPLLPPVMINVFCVARTTTPNTVKITGYSRQSRTGLARRTPSVSR